MSEMVPSALLQGQAIKLVESLIAEQESGSLSPDEVKERFLEILTEFEEHAGRPMLSYVSFEDSEPALSKKINKLWRAISADVNVSQHQLDLNRASAIATFNFLNTEIEKSKLQNAKLHNKLKSLQLYSTISDETISTFGDSFQSLDFLDRDLIEPSQVLHLAGPGYVTLPREGQFKNLAVSADVRVLDTSNGFVGNNQTATGDGGGNITFEADLVNAGNLDSLLDGAPNTWVEYEVYQISQFDKLSAGNFNFEYLDSNGERIPWADGPEGDSLKLGLEIDLGSIESVNSISFLPFPLRDGVNFPLHIRLIETSPDATNWTKVRPSGINISTDFNLSSLRAADNLTLNQGIWSFDSRSIRYVRIYVEQRTPIQESIGHSYWVDTSTENLDRVEGPIPALGEISQMRNRISSGELEQRFEIIDGQRWAIGIRDIEVNQIEYKETGSFVSGRLRVDGVVDRVVLEDADYEVPDSFDSATDWVRFYVSPDDGETWMQISEIEDVSQDIPEQIAFNDPLPASLQEAGVKNYNTDQPVQFLRFKVEMQRPSDKIASTPVLKSYRLKVKRR